MEVFFCGNIPFYSYVYHLFTYLQSPWILNGVSRANGGIYSKSYELSNTTTPWADSEINKSKKQKQSKTKAVTSVTHVRYIYISRYRHAPFALHQIGQNYSKFESQEISTRRTKTFTVEVLLPNLTL